ncbi:MAG TPA: hypothetical protein VGX96_18220 [Candidatus Elarobacter sp.]|jgi:hypothetical protein|nr:hypothetical protein [Candidatus Elarobacter sp.]
MRLLAFALAVGLAAGALPLPGRSPQAAFAAIPNNSGQNLTGPRECDEAAQLDGNGQPVVPAGATQVGGSDTFTEDRGSLASLYPDRLTNTDAMYPLPCDPSIGGASPPPVPTPSPDELDAANALQKFDQVKAPLIAKQAQTGSLPRPQFPGGKVVGCKIQGQNVPCDSPLFLRSGQPFEGRDVIYVHGLQLHQIKDRIKHKAGAIQTWPANQAAFLNAGGYYRADAEAYWHDHIRENLFDPDGNHTNPNSGWQWTSTDQQPVYVPKSNRYLIVAWSSNQTIDYAQSALLTQLDLAMRYGTNVVTPPAYPASHVRPFCSNGCVIVSHSAGSLVTSTSMSIAAHGGFGFGGMLMASRIYAHVSFEGAISGSPLATIGVAAAQGMTVPAALCNVWTNMLNFSSGCSANASTAFVAHSILRDLIPYVAQNVWGPILNESPVPTLTIAGGHPSANDYSITKIVLPGLDDGVVSMNSACGNPNPALLGPPPSGLVPTSLVKAFDMTENGAQFMRNAKLFLSQENVGQLAPAPTYLASACTPYLSTTGMVMPVLAAFGSTPFDARRRYKNHYSFIQGVIDHSFDPGDPSNQWPSAAGNPAWWLRHYLHYSIDNVEETSAVTDANIYQQFNDGTYLVHPSFANIHEIVRGRSFQYKLFGKIHRVWIWKRTYHLLDKWEKKQSSHYVYEFVGRR